MPMGSAIRMTFPMSVGAGAVLLPDRPTPDAVLDTMQRHQPTIFAGVPTLYASMLANPRIGPRRRIGPAAPLHLRRRGAARGYRPALVRHGRRGHPRRHRLDRDAAYLRLQPRRRHPLWHIGQAGAGLRGDDPGRTWRPRAEWRGRRTGGARSVRGRRLLEPAGQDAAHVPRRVDAHRRHLYARCRRLLPLLRPQRRDAEGERRLGVAVRGGGGAGLASGGAGSRRWWARRIATG